MKKVYIVEAKRSPIGSFLGALKNMPAGELGGIVLKAILNGHPGLSEKLDEVLIGNVLPAGQGQGIARQVAICAQVPPEVPAYAVNMVCGSGMKTVMNAYANVAMGWHRLVAAGGVEVMSQAPFILPSAIRGGNKLGAMKVMDHLVDDGLTDVFNQYHMGITAENIAEHYGISRQEQDEFAFESLRRAIDAVDNGRFTDEIAPVAIQDRKGTFIFDKDEYPNRSTNPEKMAALKPAFKKDGTVTAGNSSGINDGAGMVLLASEDAISQFGLTPLAEIIGIGQGGVQPSIMGMGPVPAIRNALLHAGVTLKQIELIELNEAFAAQSLGVLRALSEEHGISIEELKSYTNVNGGAIALGHPLGASGARILATLVHEMKKRGSRLGLASLCIGGGMGTAVIVKQC